MSEDWGKVEWFRNKLKNQGSDAGSAYFGHSNNAYQKMRHRWIVEHTIKSLPFTPKNIFDFGCAIGELTVEFATNLPHANAHGYDFVEELIEEAKSIKSNVQFEVNALPNIPVTMPDQSLTVLSEVLYYLPQIERVETIRNISVAAEGSHAISMSSTVGERYFTVESAIEILKTEFPNVKVHSFSMPIYKKIYGYSQAFESLCGTAQSSNRPKRRIERLAQLVWRIAPLRWSMILVRFLCRSFVSSSSLLKLSLWMENRNHSLESATNILVVAYR